MKRIYVSPRVVEVNVETAEMLAASAPAYRNIRDGGTVSGESEAADWGSLWN